MIDVLITGAGIVGSWLALQLARNDLLVAVCDATSRGNDGITGRNSGVLHAGIYYPEHSLKARLCADGRRATAEFAARYNIPHQICGKLIVSGTFDPGDKEEQSRAQAELESLMRLGKRNGALDLKIINKPGKKYQHVLGDQALLSPHTGVIDVPAYLKVVRRLAEEAGAMFLMRRQLIELSQDQAVLAATNEIGQLEAAGERESIQFQKFINAAGLQCAQIAELAGLNGYTIQPVRGEYYRLARRLPDDILVYPLPARDSTALGVHYTFQPDGEAYAGPNAVPARDFHDYQISMSAEEFYGSLCRITDFYQLSDLSPGYSGLRPRLFKNGEPIRDFIIESYMDTQIHLLGIESPGLTCAPALAEHIYAEYF